MGGSRFVGVGVGRYDGPWDELAYPVPEVEDFAERLGVRFSCTLLADPVEDDVRGALRQVRGSMPEGGCLVVLWAGHGIASPADGLRLLTRDSRGFAADGVGAAGDVAGSCAESGANQVLLIIDTCFSGEAAGAGEVAARIMQASPPAGGHVWVGVLTSCLPAETARDGVFGPRLAALLERGPVTAELRVRWSPHSAFIRGDDLCDAVLKEWDSPAQSPDFVSRGSAWWMFANPLYDPGAPEQVVEHLLLAARGGAAAGEGSWFTGRTTEVSLVAAWVRSRQPGLHVITGSAGTGKTAIAGRVVSLSNPGERARLLAAGAVPGVADPGERSVAAHVHARGLTADRAAAEIGAQLVRADVLTAQADPRNAAELAGQLQRAAEAGAVPPVIVADGLDEARGEAFTIAEDLLLRLAPYATVIVSTRQLRRGETGPSLLEVLTAGEAELDLDDPAVRERGRADLRDYVAARLAGADPSMDPDAVADHVAERVSMTSGEPFLLARLVADQLRAAPVNTTRPGWQEQVSGSAGGAFDADLARVRAPRAAGTVAGRPAAQAARILLAALTWGLGAGLPEQEWLACASAAGGEFGRDDVSWVLDELGRYIVQDGEAGTAVYRIAHQSLADHVRPPFSASYRQPFDPQAGPVAAALLSRYRSLLVQGVPVDGPGYLWLYSWRHAAAAGPDGLALLRDLAAGHPALLLDVADAALDVSQRLALWGYRLEAVAPAEEAAGLYRELAAATPAFLGDLAGALNNLGICYSGVGRLQKAVAPAEEAAGLYRELAAANPAFVPDLAMALNNLGSRYSEVGRRQEAVAPAEEAAGLRRELAAANPAFVPNLAAALNNLGNRYSEVGRLQEAVAPVDEAAALYRELAAANPAFVPNLAGALNNLGNCYSEVGRRQEAVAPAEEAAGLYRELAAANPAFVPDLAMALNNLGSRYSEVGRRLEAVAPVEEAVGLRRELAAANPAFVPNLAAALNNLGIRYSGVGRRLEAVAPAEEAAGLYRELAAANPAFLPDLAMALNNLGTHYSGVGRRQEGVALVEEAVGLYWEVAAANPAFLPDLAMALNNLGTHYSAVGRRQEGVALVEEAAGLYREVAAANPAFLPDLAGALNNLGIRFSEVGRRREAVTCVEEAVSLYRELAVANPAFLPDLATALNNLGSCHQEIGSPELADAAWEQSVAEAEPGARAYLLVMRASAADAGHPGSAPWLASALDLAEEDRELSAAIHQQARRHHAADPAGFESAWAGQTGELIPAWLTVDAGLLAAAQAWVATETYEAERDYLAAHPELLEAAAGTAVAEALLEVSEDAAGRYATLREAAQREGAETAYQPLLLGLLAAEFASAGPGRQRVLLAERGQDLDTETVAAALDEIARQGGETAAAARRAAALLQLARTGDAEAVFGALADPGQFPALLRAVAARPDPAALAAAATVAAVTAQTDGELALATFWLAAAVAAGGEDARAAALLEQARRLDPAQGTAWIGELAAMGQQHPAVLPLIPALTTPPPGPPAVTPTGGEQEETI